MKLSNVAALYGVRLRKQFGQELLALVGIAIGVSLLFAALVANTSLTGSFERLTNAVVGNARYQVTARGPGFDESLLRDVRRLPSVRAAAAFLEVHAEVRTPTGHRSILLIGATPGFAELGGTLTRGFSYGFLAGVRAIALPTPLAEDLGLALGQSVELDVRGRLVSAPMGTKLQVSDIGNLIDSQFAVGQLPYVQELSGLSDQITRISVVPNPGRDAEVEHELVQLAAGRANVRPANFEAELFRQAALPTSQSTMMFALFSALVGFLFSFSAVLLTVPQRRRLIADLHTEGYGPGTAVKVLMLDALALGIVASACGILLGIQVSQRVFNETPGFLGYAFSFDTKQIITPGNVIIAAVSGIVASCMAVLGPTAKMVFGSHRDVRAVHRPGAGVRIPPSSLAIAGLVCWMVAVGIVVVSPSSAGVALGGLVLLTAAMLALLPLMLGLLVKMVEAATHSVRSIVPFLAIADLRDPRTRVRSIAVAATGAVAVFATVALQGAHADLQRGLDRTSHDLAANAALWIVPPGQANLLATTAFPMPSFRLPAEIATVKAYRGSFLDVGGRRVWVLGSPATSSLPIPRGQMIEGETTLATRRLRTGGWAVVSAALAREQHLHVGGGFVLPAPVPTRLRVAGLSTNMGWPSGAIVVNADDYAHAWGSADVSALHATPAPDVSPAAARAALRAALGPKSGLVVETSSDRERGQRAASRRGLARLTQIAALVLVSAMIAMAAAMAGMIWQRQRFLAAMKVEGYSAYELWRSLLLEAGVLIGAGCVIGAAFGLFGQGLLSCALTSVTGFPVAYSLAALGALQTSIALTVVTAAVVALFGIRAARIPAARGLS